MVKSRIGYIVFLAVIAVFSLFYSWFVVKVALYACIAVLIILYIPVVVFVRRLRLDFESEICMLQSGDEGVIKLVVKNPCPFGMSNVRLFVEATAFYTNEKEKQEYVLNLKKNSQQSVLIKLKSRHCGKLLIKAKKLKGFESLGVLSMSKRFKAELKAFVMPAFDSFGQQYIDVATDDMGSEFSTVKGGDDYAQTFDYHTYREGDKLKYINWKLSGKQDELLAREGSLPVSSRACIMLDIKELEDLDAFDAMLSSAASISFDFIADKTPHDVGFYSDKYGCCRFFGISSMDDFYYAMTVLYEARLTKGAERKVFPEFISVAKSASYASIILIVEKISEEDCADIIMLCRMQASISVLTASGEDAGRESDLLEDNGIELMYIYKNTN